MIDDKLSLSVFTIEVDRKPVIAFVARKYSEAEAICAEQRIRANNVTCRHLVKYMAKSLNC
ncbi:MULTISPECIES: hypothetical protein [unclassified Bradyrhizobium]|uniref:hypothetical protein n=1 Tax=unclassified Bradyrhizobium TaxID=2631580 RepID=UPI001FF7D676|nr:MULTISPECIES: hypothetical protein [unclassified Bradyrhizobium]MCK1712095.1 hypothetical protein [Bradyrhizobium sp. 143]MCK1732071.1 hypothetical protein [Bradyrhizobium sp. 142]